MFSVQNTPQKFEKKKQSCWNSQARESQNYRDSIAFEKLSSQNAFCTQKRNEGVVKFLELKNVLEKLCFPDGFSVDGWANHRIKFLRRIVEALY